MRSQHIRALTGVRFFAALWVVVYHSTRHNFPFLYSHHHDAVVAVSPLVIAGVRGVDLFFILSGFVLALNYMDQLGTRVRLRPTLRFLWLRLARIWPLYMLVIVGAGAAAGDPPRPLALGARRPADLVDVPQAGADGAAVVPARPRPDQLGGSGLVALGRVAGLPGLPDRDPGRRPVAPPAAGTHPVRAAGVVMIPLVVGISVRHDMGGHVWVARILCEFTPGCCCVPRPRGWT